MRVVRGRRLTCPRRWPRARREAARAFGDDRLILERLLEGRATSRSRSCSTQHGHGVHLGERDCSAQRRNQKIVEEAPAPSVSDALRERMGAAALAVAEAVGYVGAGTVEFLVDDDGGFYFLEMNTRLQVEHPVTEAVTGRDLVADQLRIAAGEPLGLDQRQRARPRPRHRGAPLRRGSGGAASCRPPVGSLRLRWPDGVRDRHRHPRGRRVSDRYDPMLAKLIAHGPTRDEALARLRGALDETLVLGVRTNLRFLRWLLDQPAMRDGEVRTDTIAGLELPEPPHRDDAAWRAAAAALLARDRAAAPWGGGWRASAPAAVRLRHGDEERRVELAGRDRRGRGRRPAGSRTSTSRASRSSSSLAAAADRRGGGAPCVRPRRAAAPR